jgi:hypothetical protein
VIPNVFTAKNVPDYYIQNATTRWALSRESVDLAARDTISPRFSQEVCITSLNAHLAGIESGTKYSCLSTLSRYGQRTPIQRTHSIRWLYYYGELAIRAFDGVDFYSFDFVRVYRDDQLVNLLTEKVLGIPML